MNRILIMKANVLNKFIRFLVLLIVCFSMLPTYAYSQKEKTFGEIKKELLGKQVYIYGNKYVNSYSPGQESLLGWKIVAKDGEGKSLYSNDKVPYSLRGSKGIVESIVINKLSANYNKKTSAFGEKITDDDLIDPYLSLVVKLDDGTLISCDHYYSLLDDNLKLASKVDAERNEIEKNINSVVGKVIYPLASSRIYPSKTDLETMIDSYQQVLDALYNYDLLTPLKITRAKYIESQYSILLEFNYDNGKSAVTLINLKYISNDRTKLNPKNYWDNLVLKGGFLEKILSTSGFTTKIPNFLTKKEIEAIKKRSIFRGMSEEALWLSWGYDHKKNDWGRGGKQYIYNDKQYVYVEKGKVIDWQSLK